MIKQDILKENFISLAKKLEKRWGFQQDTITQEGLQALANLLTHIPLKMYEVRI